jgi:predicted alpha/beta superfamily hydrolase
MKKISLLLIVSLLQISICAQDSIIIGKYKKIDSKILGGKVTYLEHLPDGYENSNKDYPVMFMMNGQIIPAFANAAATLDNLSNDRIPDMILIGIANEGVAGNYWSCPDDSGFVSGGEKFHAFLEKELIPEIKKNYRTNDFKILAGQSNTGLYVIYNLLFYPDLFNAYIVASPMFDFCPDFFLNRTKSFLKENTDKNKKLYVSYGDMDYVEVMGHIDNFKELLKESSESLKWKVDLIENTGHVPLITINNALLFFFSEFTLTAERKKLSVSDIDTHYDKLSREYGFTVKPKAAALFDLAIDLKNGKKFDEAIEWFKYLISLYPRSETYFFFLGQTYQEKGDIESAKVNYNESLKIDSAYARAKIALEKLSE